MNIHDHHSTITQSADRVRANSSGSVNHRIDQDIATQVSNYANQPISNIAHRIEALEKEWDTERVLEMNASLLAFTGLILGVFLNQNWLWLTGIVLPFLFQHAVQGWCPPLPIIRRLGVRTRNEIDQEKFALKALRGDFARVPSVAEAAADDRARESLQAAKW